ncbi:MAG: flagellar hook-length control protein FliK [Azoarcus sp.]|jgi:flagellar hook-length control protein FliK|nr:flagellar hook-length control protein FliK [Azoarcus sp.]
MATPVSSSVLNLTASGAAGNTGSSRAADGALNASFSSLLRGQMQTGIDTRTLAQTSPMAEATHTSQTNRVPTREASRPSQATGKPREQSPARESQRDNKIEHPSTRAAERPEKQKTQDAAATATPETGAKTDSPACDTPTPTTENAPQNAAAPQTPAPDAAALPATIAALLGAIAGTDVDHAADEVATEEAGVETSARDALAGRARHASTQAGNAADLASSGAAAKTNAAPANTAAAVAAPPLNATAASLRAETSTQAITANASAETTPTAMPNALRTTAQESAALPRFTVSAAAGQRAWAEEAGNKIMWMLGRAESRAELILTPPNLGKVEVSINLNGDQTTAQFVASSQAARDALEQAMPRLRELLAQAGIDLGNASVDTSAEGQTRDDDGARAAGRTPAGGEHDGGNDDATVVTSGNWVKLDNGLVNIFA